MLSEQNKSIALRFAKEGWGNIAGWENVWNELVASDVVYHFCSWAEPIRGLEANKDFQNSLFQGFPDIQQTIEDAIASDDQVVYRHTLQGVHTGYFMGIHPTGKRVITNGFTLVRISEGKIVEWWYETNLLEVMKQLGVISGAT
jgi:predicted ester cyclase